MGSPLDFISTEGFRKKLVSRNLVPYVKSPTKVTPPTNYEIIQSDLVPVDSDDSLIDTPFFADKLYPLNKWGNDGGYQQLPDLPVNVIAPNKGEYGPGQQDAKLLNDAQIAAKVGFPGIAPAWQPLNAYGNNGLNLIDAGEAITTPDSISNSLTGGVPNLYNNQAYPTTFNSSSYSPLSILLSPNPQGSNGRLSDDSFIARLGARTLRREFQERIGRAIVRETIGRANFLNINSSTNVVNILTGRVPLIEPNYQITVLANPITAAADFALKLAGSELPFSLIPGSYFDPNINPPRPGTIAQSLLANPIAAVGNFVSNLLGAGKTGSQIFYNNTGGGQKSILWKNINFNQYKPNYDRTLLDRLGGVIVGTQTNNANFYVGSTTSDPSRVFSPSRELPVNAFGNEQQSPVYGPQELAQLYEGPSKEIRLGANGPTYSNGGGIEGGFTWTSTKYRGNAGKKVGIGGVVTNQDEDFKPSSYNTTESTERTFKQGSILDETQRIINSQPQGGKRLQHVGNAIDQVSKVFNDGYKELTKGSRVLRYVGAIGQEVGTEYCRVFAKDVPYLQYNDLQKTDGIVTEGRRFSYSVLDKTYNLNITPNKQEGGQSSTNLINGGGGTNAGYVKKYMFSIENLAWATSSTPGYTIADLPVCEKGPNGGRVMWFPPYDLTFSENVRPNWKQNDFLGRPEPIYTYQNTSRSGSISWKIVVDHPSVLNVIVNKVLGNETNKTRIDSILESFFAGCRKYDLYELAKKYSTISKTDLIDFQEALDTKKVNKDQMEYIVKEVENVQQLAADTTNGGSSKTDLKNYEKLGFFFDNAVPKINNNKNSGSPNVNEKEQLDYNITFAEYTGDSRRKTYDDNSKSNKVNVNRFFSDVIIPNKNRIDELIEEISNQLSNNAEAIITITIEGSASAVDTQANNVRLSSRRINSGILYFSGNPKLQKYVNDGRLLFKEGRGLGENTENSNVGPMTYNEQSDTFVENIDITCGDQDSPDSKPSNEDTYSVNAMACRRAFIVDITSTIGTPKPVPPPKKTTVLTGNVVTKVVNEPVLVTKIVNKDNISKRVLRALLSECDYFETIKEETPLVYDNLRDKLKFFQPAFHSITPEGLNSRLTFLQQCMRPGDTIPTVKVENNNRYLDYSNATNTSFGTPPVLILRVGDFYNTKIIPTGLDIQYENLDINPEGIGVQPMIAKVSLNFNFVGGSGLKESVDKLQNALTFNYYANTEIYDDRADVTDDSYKVIDEDFLRSAINNVAPPTINETTPNNGQSNNNTIGEIMTTETKNGFQTGTLNYSTFMDKVVEESQNYFTNIVNKNKEIVNQYNNAVRQQWMAERIYQNGKFTITKSDKPDTILFGKPNNLEKRINKIFSKLVSDIKSEDEGFMKFIIDGKKFPNKLVRQLRENYINFVKGKSNTFQNAVTTISNNMVSVQQNYIGYIGRINTITYNVPLQTYLETGTDGYQISDGKVVSYIITGTTEVDSSSTNAANTFVELNNDVKKIKESIDEFNKISNNPIEFSFNNEEYSGILVFKSDYKLNIDDVFIPFSKGNFDDKIFRRVYMILSNDVVDSKKYETFKNALIGNIINNQGLLGKSTAKLDTEFDTYWLNTVKPQFENENKITTRFIEESEKELKGFLKFTPYNLKKKRTFTYNTEGANTEPQQKLIRGLGWIENQNTNNKTWNDESPDDVFISKAKLN
jgi:hypothetical protein